MKPSNARRDFARQPRPPSIPSATETTTKHLDQTEYLNPKPQTKAKVMKPYTYAFLAAAAACGLANAETAYTTPVGYVSLGDTTTGQPAIKASTDVAVSIPLHRPTEYAGAISATTANSITVAGTPAWATDQWNPGAASPYLVAITSGVQNGYIGLITGNNANTLTVTPVTLGSLLITTSPDPVNVVAGDTVKIFKAWTLASLFPVGTLGNGVRLLGFTGNVSGVNLSPNLIYTMGVAGWTLDGNDANNTILYSGESFVIRTGSTTSAATLTIAGEVPTFKSRTDIAKITAGVGQDTRLSYFSPAEEIIGNTGLAGSLTNGDRLLGFNNNASGTNKSPVEILTLSSGTWLLDGNDVTNTYTLKPGVGYVVRRASSAAVGVVEWIDEQSYLPLP